MRPAPRVACCLALALLLGPAAEANEPRPGSVLIYPVVRSGNGFITLLAVTNTNLTAITPGNPFGGSTDVHYQYVQALPSADPFLPLDCELSDSVRELTPADTRVISVTCEVPVFPFEGYLLVSAEDPAEFETPWSHNYLIGSELVANGAGAVYALPAVSFRALAADGEQSDSDSDGELDFDGLEYEFCPDVLILDAFTGGLGVRLALVSLTGGPQFLTTVDLDVWNDNEFPMGTTVAFRCWFDQALAVVSPVFDPAFLANNTPHAPNELDVDCDLVGDLETGWVRMRGASSVSTAQYIPSPAIVGAVTGGPLGFERGRPLWRVGNLPTGKFLNDGVIDPEFP